MFPLKIVELSSKESDDCSGSYTECVETPDPNINARNDLNDRLIMTNS